MDLPDGGENLERFRGRFAKAECIGISALERSGLEELRGRLRELAGSRPE